MAKDSQDLIQLAKLKLRDKEISVVPSDVNPMPSDDSRCALPLLLREAALGTPLEVLGMKGGCSAERVVLQTARRPDGKTMQKEKLKDGEE
mmetsp:Transcript_19572/g.34731  ORF Transcript_19572/g.34731 Transcript_19572/m.34731 type:complete len:91 (+) Transcript_19572:92-364(+)